jgi:hypothetical protein
MSLVFASDDALAAHAGSESSSEKSGAGGDGAVECRRVQQRPQGQNLEASQTELPLRLPQPVPVGIVTCWLTWSLPCGDELQRNKVTEVAVDVVLTSVRAERANDPRRGPDAG